MRRDVKLHLRPGLPGTVLSRTRLKAFLGSREGLATLKELSKGRFFSLRTRAKHMALLGLPPSTAKTQCGHYLGSMATNSLDIMCRQATIWAERKFKGIIPSYKATISVQTDNLQSVEVSVQTDSQICDTSIEAAPEEFPHNADFVPFYQGRPTRTWSRYFDPPKERPDRAVVIPQSPEYTHSAEAPFEPMSKTIPDFPEPKMACSFCGKTEFYAIGGPTDPEMGFLAVRTSRGLKAPPFKRLTSRYIKRVAHYKELVRIAHKLILDSRRKCNCIASDAPGLRRILGWELEDQTLSDLE